MRVCVCHFFLLSLQRNCKRIMAQQELVKLFDSVKIRVVWDDEQEKYYFSIVDVVRVLTEQPDHRHAAKYWSVVKTRLRKEGSELTSICSQLKMVRKWRETRVPTSSSVWGTPLLATRKRLTIFSRKTNCHSNLNNRVLFLLS